LGGHLFKSKPRFPVKGKGDDQENKLARLTLKCILLNDTITATIPGLTSVHEAENAVKASYELKAGVTKQEKAWLEKQTQQRLALLPEDYKWLKDWQIV